MEGGQAVSTRVDHPPQMISTDDVKPGHTGLTPLSVGRFVQKAGLVGTELEDALAVILPCTLASLKKQYAKLFTEEFT